MTSDMKNRWRAPQLPGGLHSNVETLPNAAAVILDVDGCGMVERSCCRWRRVSADGVQGELGGVKNARATILSDI